MADEPDQKKKRQPRQRRNFAALLAESDMRRRVASELLKGAIEDHEDVSCTIVEAAVNVLEGGGE